MATDVTAAGRTENRNNFTDEANRGRPLRGFCFDADDLLQGAGLHG